MVRTFLKVYMELGFFFLFLQEQIKNIIIISDRPSKQPRMLGSTLGVYSFGLIFVSARRINRHQIAIIAKSDL